MSFRFSRGMAFYFRFWQISGLQALLLPEPRVSETLNPPILQGFVSKKYKLLNHVSTYPTVREHGLLVAEIRFKILASGLRLSFEPVVSASRLPIEPTCYN